MMVRLVPGHEILEVHGAGCVQVHRMCPRIEGGGGRRMQWGRGPELIHVGAYL